MSFLSKYDPVVSVKQAHDVVVHSDDDRTRPILFRGKEPFRSPIPRLHAITAFFMSAQNAKPRQSRKGGLRIGCLRKSFELVLEGRIHLIGTEGLDQTDAVIVRFANDLEGGFTLSVPDRIT